MANIKPGAIHNPFPHGLEATRCKTPAHFSPKGYDYRNHLMTLHPENRWCKMLAYVVYSEKRGWKATSKDYSRVAGVTNTGIWCALRNAGYIYSDNGFKPTQIGRDCIALIEKEFHTQFCWNREGNVKLVGPQMVLGL